MNQFLIVGLGNPGSQYTFSRHNTGFLFLDKLSDKFNVSFQSKDFLSICKFELNGYVVFLLKPQTYMNLSGKAVSFIKSFYKIKDDDVIVFHDDLDLKFSRCKFKFAGSSGGHNGLKDIDKFISNQYWRFRFGIDRPTDNVNISSYVLSNFSASELEKISQTAEIVFDNFDLFLKKDQKKISSLFR